MSSFSNDKNEKKIRSFSLGRLLIPRLATLLVLFVILIGAILYFVWPSLRDDAGQTVQNSSVTLEAKIDNKKKITGNSAISGSNLLQFDNKDTDQLPIQAPQSIAADSVSLHTILEQIKNIEKSIRLANSSSLETADLMQIESNAKRVDALEAQLTTMSPISREMVKDNQIENIPLYAGKQFVDVTRIEVLENRFRQIISEGKERRNQELEKIKEEYNLVIERLSALEKTMISREQAASQQNEAIFLTIEISKLARKASTALPFGRELKMVEFINPFKGLLNHKFNKAIETMGTYSQNGMATISDLSASFDSMAYNVIKSDVLAEDEGWVDATIGKLRQIVTVRRVGGNIDPESLEGKLGKARIALSAGNLNLVTKIFDAIPSNARKGADSWLKKIRARLQIDSSLEVLEQEALTLIKQSRLSRIDREHD